MRFNLWEFKIGDNSGLYFHQVLCGANDDVISMESSGNAELSSVQVPEKHEVSWSLNSGFSY